MDLILDLSQIRILSALAMLIVGSILDLRNREIHDSLWIGFGGLSVVLLFLEDDVYSQLLNIGLSLIVVPFVVLIWRLGLFGGADSFAIIVLASLAPQMTFSENIVSPFTVLTNALLLSALTLLVIMGKNLISLLNKQDIFEGINETMIRKIFAMFIGYRAKNPKHSFSLEKFENNTKKLNFTLHHSETTDFCTTPNTWVTPGIPFLIYIFVGFVLQLLVGDIILNFLFSFLNLS